MYKPGDSLREKSKELIKLNPKKMTDENIRSCKDLTMYLFEHCLPYKAKNGVYFSSNGVSLCTNRGIVIGDNGYRGKDNHYFMLRHVLSAGTGETKYSTSCAVDAFGVSALEKLSLKIEENVRKIAAEMLKGFE